MEYLTDNIPPSKLAPPQILGKRDVKVALKKMDSLQSSLAFLKRRTSAQLIRITKAPEEIRSVLRQLDEIHKAKGVLRISGKLSFALLCLIVMHRKFDKIKQIVLANFTSVALVEFEAKYEANISRFKELFGIAVPREVIHYANYCHQINAAFDEYLLGQEAVGGGLYLYGYEGLCGVWGKVFSERELSESDILTDRHGHHELSYFPMFEYGSDGVSHGLVFDYQANSFSGVAYYGDGTYGGCDQMMEGLFHYALEANESTWDFIPEDILEPLDKDNDFRDFCALVQDVKNELLPWFIALTASGYVSELPLSVPRPKPASLLRYGYRNEQAKAKLENKGFYFVKETYPACVVKFNNVFEKRRSSERENDKAFLDKIFSGMNWEESNSYELVKCLITNEQLDLIGGVCGEFSLVFDKDGKLTDKSDEEIFEFQIRLAEKRAREGFYELAFCMVFALWNKGTEKSTEYAVRLSEIMPDDVLHPIMKIMVRHHAKTRFDNYIMS